MKIKNIKQLTYLAKNGDCDAIVYLANYFFDNRDQDDNDKKAFDYLVSAVEHKKNDGELLYKLGTCYQFGIGTSQNIEKAIFVLKQASSIKNSNAQNALGLIYMYGEGVEKNYKVARKYFLESKKNCNVDAGFHLNILPVEIELNKVTNFSTLDKDEQQNQRILVEKTYNNFNDEQKVYFFRHLANQVKLDMTSHTLSDTKITMFFDCFITTLNILKFINTDELIYLGNMLIEALNHYTTSEEFSLNKQALVYYYLADICVGKQAITYCNTALDIFKTIEQKNYQEEVEYKFFTICKLINLEYKEKNYDEVTTLSTYYFSFYNNNQDILKKFTNYINGAQTTIAYNCMQTKNYSEAEKLANEFLKDSTSSQDNHYLLTMARYYDILAQIEYFKGSQKTDELYEKCYKCLNKTTYNKFWKQSYLVGFKLHHATSLLKTNKKTAMQVLKELYTYSINKHFAGILDKLIEIVQLYCNTLVEDKQIENAIAFYNDFNNEISHNGIIYDNIGSDKIYILNANNLYKIAMLYRSINSTENEKKYLLKAYEKLQKVLNRDDEFEDIFKKVAKNLEKYN